MPDPVIHALLQSVPLMCSLVDISLSPHLSSPYHASLLYPFIHSLPSSCLVNPLSDEVCWESVLELPFVFKGVVGLGVRHAATLKPAVEHLRDPPQHTLATPGGDCQTVNAGWRKFGMRGGNKTKQEYNYEDKWQH